MRDLIFVDVPRTREEVRAGIERPERFRPEPRLLRALPWRDDLHPAVAAVYRGLERGEPLAALIERGEALVEKKLPGVFEQEIRRHVLDLQKAGHVAIDFEPAPAVYADRYERVRELGRGGMGIAELCADRERGGALVVVKHAWGWTSPVHRSEYTNRREARVMRMLDHPAFPRLRDAFEVGGILHMVRDYVDGPILSARHVPTWKERCEVGAQIADALAHLHDRGLVYLDAKPGNFLLGHDGRVRIIDLGVARSVEELAAKSSKKFGSPGFAAPEIRKSRAATPISDQYSLGAVLFTLACGGRPRRGWDERGIVDAMRAAQLDAEEQAIIARMTDWDPARRYADMRAVASALRG